MTLSNQDRQILVVSTAGLYKVKSPYLDHPDYLRDVYKWMLDDDLHQP